MFSQTTEKQFINFLQKQHQCQEKDVFITLKGGSDECYLYLYSNQLLKLTRLANVQSDIIKTQLSYICNGGGQICCGGGGCENCIKVSICERKYDQNEQGGKVLFGRPKHILRCLTNRGFRINRVGVGAQNFCQHISHSKEFLYSIHLQFFMLRWTQFSKVGQHYSTKHEKLIKGGS